MSQSKAAITITPCVVPLGILPAIVFVIISYLAVYEVISKLAFLITATIIVGYYVVGSILICVFSCCCACCLIGVGGAAVVASSV